MPARTSCWMPYCGKGFAVGTPISECPPPRSGRARLRHPAPTSGGNGKALARPRVKDVRFREPVVGELRDAIPGGAVPLAASSERAPPEVGHVLPERRERPAAARIRPNGSQKMT